MYTNLSTTQYFVVIVACTHVGSATATASFKDLVLVVEVNSTKDILDEDHLWTQYHFPRSINSTKQTVEQSTGHLF